MLCDGWGLPCCLATTLAAGLPPRARGAMDLPIKRTSTVTNSATPARLAVRNARNHHTGEARQETQI
jgi:hypothetical protein